MRTLCLVLITALGTAAACYFGQQYLPESFQPPRPSTQGTGTGLKADPTKAPAGSDVVSALGRLEPETEIIGVGGPAGARIARLGSPEGESRPLREGDGVKKDDALAYLDSYDEMLAARDHARTALKEAEQRLAAETSYGDALITEAKENIRQARDVMPLAIDAQDAEVKRGSAELDKLRIDLKRSEQMFNDKAIPQSMHDSAKLAVTQAEQMLARGKATLEQMKKDRDVKLLQTAAQLKSAEAGKIRAELMPQVESLKAALKLAEARLERTVIRAPIGGEIIKIHTRPGETIGTLPILKLADIDQMVVVAEVYETDIRLIKPGQKATITSKAFPGQELTGTVERINKLVYKNDVLKIDPRAATDARVIETRIKLDDSTVAKRYNYLQVDVQIKVAD